MAQAKASYLNGVLNLTCPKADVIAKIAELRSLMPGGREASPHTPEQVQLVKDWKAGS